MDSTVVGVIGLILVFTLMALELPIGFSFLIVGFLGLACIAGIGPALSALARISFSWVIEYVFICIPLFILVGLLLSNTGIANELFETGNKWLGRLPGGLAMATTGAVGLFSAVSGSSTACAATMSAVCYPQMKRHKYKDSLATGCIAAGSGIDLMIPPSLGFVVYGIFSEEAIGKLLIAGIIPGIIQVGSFFLTIYLSVKFNPELAPLRVSSSSSWNEKIRSLRSLWTIIVLFLLVMGGIYLGFFTPIEAAAIGCAGGLVITIGTGRLTWQNLVESLRTTSSVTAMIFAIVMGAMVFNVFLTLSKLPQMLSTFLNSIGSPSAGLAFIFLMYIPLGMIIDAMAMIVLTIPLYMPFLLSNNINLIWFGVVVMLLVEIGLITPPVGMNVYVVKGVIKEVPMGTIFKGMVPFLIADVLVLGLVIAFPQISLYLPTLMK